ncbi:YtxH domain-containing protein [Paenibacillus sp. BR2-3]|uniref:YtxH domain-containing protein n=1 Tax=Paenibacillus sp. BR2-3 TaxID=3048494 RepID=UPI003977C241
MDTETKKTIAVGAVAGALVGAGLAALVAPQQGQKGRSKLSSMADMVKEKGSMINEKGHLLAEKGQEVAEVIKESLGVIKELKNEAQIVTQDIKSEIQSFKQEQTI